MTGHSRKNNIFFHMAGNGYSLAHRKRKSHPLGVPAIKQSVMQNHIDKVQFVCYTNNIFALFYRQAVNYGLQKG